MNTEGVTTVRSTTLPDPTAPGMAPVWFVLGIWALYALMGLIAYQAIT